MTLSIKNCGYAFLIRSDLMFSMSLWKEFQVLRILNDLTIRHLITCASCSSSNNCETCGHFKTRIEEHIKKDNKYHIFKHLHPTTTYFDSYNSICFKIIDKANSKFDLKIKEALHINWRKPNLNAQKNHLALTLSL